ncbi:protein FAN-like, partial [Ruditapes philippinarum]|uniref:protein FAN-like n=1 Tax=Ruditapes philippinarum TaxID=129788 RepID=UPI00295BF787
MEEALSPPPQQRGHLKICSKSVVFVPKEEQFPVIKISLKNTTNIDEYAGDLYSRLNDKALTISSDVYTEMKKDSIISPYVFIKGARAHTFSLNYVTIDDCLPLISQLHRASTLPPADQNTMISAIVMSRQSRVKFNTSWLDDLYEKVELECQADKIMPLVTNPGRLMVTTSRLYFQPFNNVERSPVIKVRLKDIVSLIKRRFLLKQIGLEIKCSEHGTSQAHLYLAFKTKDIRDSFYEKIMDQPEVNLQMPDQQDMAIKWQNGIISNYDYLMYLNSAADRSFFDLTQYPVMPWVIQDFTSDHLDLEKPETFRDLSKPIGALNAERLERMKERYVDMPEPKFLYGSHYSTPGYILFYLARLVPEYVLCLQNGKFDQPDRMFNSLWEVWQNCLNGAADFKELIPEFFDGSGEFMINSGVCNFGVRQDGRPIENVDIPPWATDSRDFIKKMREALECDHVSRHLHEWIDLIFGYKQRGEEAEKADNVFYYLTYEGSVDLDSIKDPNERACMEIQIMEFGQVPKQLFTTPHPVRSTSKEHPPDMAIPPHVISHEHRSKTPETDQVEEDAILQTVDFTNMHKIVTFSKHKDSITDVKLCLEKKMAFSVSQDSLLKLYCLEEQRQLRSVTIANMALSSCIVMPDCKTVICGAWDNNVYFYSVEYGNILDTLHAHDDAVINIYWRNDLLFTASWDSTVKLWQMPCPTADDSFIAAEYFVSFLFYH